MAAAAREFVTVAGRRAERARAARAFGVGVPGPGHPHGGDAPLLASCPVIACRTAGRRAGELVTVAVHAGAAGCGPRSPIAAVPGCRSCAGPVVMAERAAGFSS
jgi:hypothetical protein